MIRPDQIDQARFPKLWDLFHHKQLRSYPEDTRVLELQGDGYTAYRDSFGIRIEYPETKWVWRESDIQTVLGAGEPLESFLGMAFGE